MPARYVGVPQVQFLEDGRVVELLADLEFYQSDETRWAVPAGARVDGASIPQIFWSVVGGPFEGRYRDASIIHDWFCDRRTRSWQDTHRVFYDAMLVSGVTPTRAKIMYLAVYYGGPRWETRVTWNTNLDVSTKFHFSTGLPRETKIFTAQNPAYGKTDAQQLAFLRNVSNKIEADDLTIQDIEQIVDRSRA